MRAKNGEGNLPCPHAGFLFEAHRSPFAQLLWNVLFLHLSRLLVMEGMPAAQIKRLLPFLLMQETAKLLRRPLVWTEVLARRPLHTSDPVPSGTLHPTAGQTVSSLGHSVEIHWHSDQQGAVTCFHLPGEAVNSGQAHEALDILGPFPWKTGQIEKKMFLLFFTAKHSMPSTNRKTKTKEESDPNPSW